jgi:heme/copper-type cytochrome/quinol oxidase subunit 1
VLLVGMLLVVGNMLWSLWKGRRAPVDHWDHAEFNKTLVWQVDSPPPADNFASIHAFR